LHDGSPEVITLVESYHTMPQFACPKTHDTPEFQACKKQLMSLPPSPEPKRKR
jgi:hypothetical protein